MSKRNVAYVKPQEPSFLRRMKEQIGYREGPTVDTKRQKLEDLSGSDYDSDYEGGADHQKATGDREDEKPQVVVLGEGDLTAEQAEAEKVRLEKEEREKPADLKERIIFKAKHKPTKDIDSGLVKSSTENSEKSEKGKEKKKKKKSKHTSTVGKLSFAQDDDEEEEH